MGELKAEREDKGQVELDERFTIVQELRIGIRIVEIDGDRSVFAFGFGGLGHVSSPGYLPRASKRSIPEIAMIQAY